MSILANILGMSSVEGSFSPVSGDLWLSSNQRWMADFSYVLPSRAMTGSMKVS